MVVALVIALFGALIGSFANVVIYRLPRGESVAFPGSHCPNCGHELNALELVPVLSWAALGARCRGCKAGISARYPIVEALVAFGFFALALRFPPEVLGFTVFPLLALFALLVMSSVIDLDTHLLPDVLTFPALGLALLGAAAFYTPGSGLPSFVGALYGACLGAGVLALLNRLGALVLRRFADTKERLWPVGMDQLGVAAVLGAFGWPFGLAGAAASLAANVVTQRPLRLPEPLLYGLWLVVVVVMTVLLPSPLTAISGSLVAAGGAALVGALYWWVHDLRNPQPEPETDDDEPVAMGFGDVKLAGVLGAMLGAQNLLVALMLAFLFGAVGGLIGRALGRGRIVPFGPYLVAGAWVALFYGTPLVAWYMGTLGL